MKLVRKVLGVPDSEDDLEAEEAVVAQILTSATEDEEHALQSGTREAVGMRALQLFMEDYAADSEPSWRGPIPAWARHQVAAFADAPAAAATGGPNVTVAPDSNAAIGAASNPPGAKARHQPPCTHFVRDALAFRFINLKHVATDRQFAGVSTGAPTASMPMLLETLVDGTATVPLLARLYQWRALSLRYFFSVLVFYSYTHIIFSSWLSINADIRTMHSRHNICGDSALLMGGVAELC